MNPLTKNPNQILVSLLLFFIMAPILAFFLLLTYTTEHSTSILAMNLMAGSINGKFFKSLQERLSVISVLINNVCNLKCKHCYLQAKKNGEYLTNKEWNKFFKSLLSETRPETLCFAGKEVFFDKASSDILFDAIQLRNHIQKPDTPSTEIGVITNGTLLHNHSEAIRQMPPDYIDISVDGLPHQHNHIRGTGTFEQMGGNLKWLMKEFQGNIWITHTVMSDNLRSLPEFIGYMHDQFGIKNFSIGLFKETSNTDNRLKLDQDSISELFLNTFNALREITLIKSVQITLEVDYTQTEFLPHLISEGWVDDTIPFSSVSRQLGNDLQLTVNSANIPVGLWRAVRVTPEGYWLAAEDLMEVRNYPLVETAKLRDYHFNSEALYQAGLHSHRLKRLYENQPALIKNQTENKTPELQTI